MRHVPQFPGPLPGLVLSSLALLIALDGCGVTPASAPTTSLARTSAASTDAPTLAAPGAGPMDALWPNDDRRFWQYRLVQTTTDGTLPIYPPGVAVPPAPSVWDIAAQLRSESTGKPVRDPVAGEISGTYWLTFNGRITTQSGAEGQSLVERLVPDVTVLPVSNVPPAFALTDAALPAFWARLAAARPDLAPALRKRFGGSARTPQESLFPPILLHGGAWEKTAEHIGTYGDLNRDIAWLYLLADVQAGSTFDLQLVPDLATDVWLHGLVLPRRYESKPRPTPGAVQVLYLIDYGVSMATSATGEDLGSYRSLEYGTVTYAPSVGPVAWLDRGDFPGPTGFTSSLRIETRGTLSLTGLAGSSFTGPP